jgi:hypothetical protein
MLSPVLGKSFVHNMHDRSMDGDGGGDLRSRADKVMLCGV